MQKPLAPGGIDLSEAARQAIMLRQLEAREQELAARLNPLLEELNRTLAQAALNFDLGTRLLAPRMRAGEFVNRRGHWEGGVLR